VTRIVVDFTRNPHWATVHFTPTSGSWMNMVEIFFGIITRQAIRRGTFTSAKDLITAIENFIDGWNDRCTPFIWTKTADQILAKAHRKNNFKHATLAFCRPARSARRSAGPTVTP